MTSRRIPLLARLGLPAIALALVTGCAPSASTAMVIDDVRVSENHLDALAEGCEEALDMAGLSGQYPDGEVRRNVASWVAQGLMADALIERANITVSDNELQEARAGLRNSELFTTTANCTDAFMGIVKLTAYVSVEGEATALAQAADVEVEINPKYGTWDTDELTIEGTGSLSSRSES